MKINNTNINFDQLETIASEAIAKLETSNANNKTRWITAIRKAVSELETNCYWNYDGAELVMMSTTSNAVYVPNGSCGCLSYTKGFPCRHRSAKRLLDLYAATI